MSWYERFLIAATLLPLLSFVVLTFFGHRLGKPRSGWLAVAAMGVSCVLSLCVLAGWHGLDEAARAELEAGAYRFHWADLGDIAITIGVKLDSLTVIMFFMVTIVSFWIFVFSIGYMAGHSDEIDGQSKYHRFFTYLSLFGFSMLGLVISSSLLFLFIFWELVGLCSYFLIGFYFDKKFATDAGIKAFVVNRVGDFGFLFGLMMVVFFLGTFDLDQAAANFGAQHAAGIGLFATGADAFTINLLGWQLSGPLLATMMGIGLFCGAMGKSAQFPLHVWLPDAMAGPTPVSALIHAATMVAAGVYLVARVFRLLTPDAQLFIAVIGCITLTITALIAIVQTDIKKVLAYSTLSQLGYMIFGMGVGAWIAALFHLMTHAFFKAMLFLGSGQVIEGCHHEQHITKMGGLRKKMPWTCWTFFVGVLAIAGAGIPWAGIGLGGYFSKDEILAVARQRAYHWPAQAEEHHAGAEPSEDPGVYSLASSANQTEHGAGPAAHVAAGEHDAGHVDQGHLSAIARAIPPLPKWMFWLPIIIAYVTPFYMMRLWWLTFMGKPRDEH
ncbi:MAG: NADH-quinone oxidoreductase subunit L, partial [Planctomycetota bacterium]